MIANRLISFVQMQVEDADLHETRDLVSKEFTAEVERLLKKAGIIGVEAVEEFFGFSYAKYNGVVKRKPRMSIKAAIDMYNVMRHHFPEAKLGPPAMPIATREEYRWLRIGQRLREANYSKFLSHMEIVSDALDHAERHAGPDRRIDEELIRILDPSLSDGDDTD